MNKDSLRKVRSEIIKLLYEVDIDKVDKAELALNLFHFLDEEKYEKNIKTLRLSKLKGE